MTFLRAWFLMYKCQLIILALAGCVRGLALGLFISAWLDAPIHFSCDVSTFRPWSRVTRNYFTSHSHSISERQ